MTLSALAVVAVALLVTAGTPGPSVAALVVRSDSAPSTEKCSLS
ncbi:hypothetical protein QZM93_16650 [Burkholderia cepacia]|nr:hypothetical protein [Burkholderia cepacia]MDN7890232.1 hypothetical protein [Burkholderia cepacia]